MKRILNRFLCAVLALTLLCVPVPPKAQAANTPLIAFTFDDGPSALTGQLLDALEARGVPATFFLNGHNGGNGLYRYSALAERMQSIGCQAANHTDRHAQFRKLTAAEMRREVTTVEDSLYTALGAPYVDLVRIPYGQNSETIRKTVDRPMILWSVDTRDWESRNADAVCAAILRGAYDGAIVLMHDSYRSTIDGALRAIDTLRERGYEFVTVSELFRRRGIELENGHVYTSAPNKGVTLDAYSAPQLISVLDDVTGLATVTVSGDEGLTFHYTTDGSAPTLASPVYTEPLRTRETIQLRVAGYDRFATRTEEAALTVAGRVAKPQIIDETGGVITLLCETDGITYYCTTDGSDPADSGVVCDGSVALGSLTRIIARRDGLRESAELTVLKTEHGAIFRDLTPNASYLAAVDDVIERGLMSGTGSWHFSPQRTTYRSEMAAVLYRLAGSPAAEPTGAFLDVPEDAWYAVAVDWANATGVLTGVSPHYFRPDVALTREQAAVVLYRFAAGAGLDTDFSAAADTVFPDASDYAQDALRWCAAHNIPARGLTALTAPIPRADWAVMLSAFCAMLPSQ
ncbi:MAG: polysaccharide deacetylase family protein [Oscillospiraceae bacterium]|nr:polysaccharide deacetylase family protein [Oscillospiraceae bacterium]